MCGASVVQWCRQLLNVQLILHLSELLGFFGNINISESDITINKDVLNMLLV